MTERMTHETYPLRHIRDLADVPMERLDACLADIKRLVMSIHTAQATIGPDIKLRTPEVVEWRDDGEEYATARVKAGGVMLFEATIQSATRPVGDATGEGR